MRSPPEAAACDACLRRTHLLALLGSHVERARHHRRLPQLLALADEELLAAVAGRRRRVVEEALAGFVPAAALAGAARAGLTAICRHAEEFPASLREAEDGPAVLHIAGDPAAVARNPSPAVAVVGARRATTYGLQVARAIGRGLAAAGVRVVSGLALGVDAAAHAGALEAGGPTVAVLAGGADRPYPPSKAQLHRRIVALEGSCVVSEMPAGFVPFRWGFPARNRIIAALASIVVVVEAAERSGSLITAELAQDLGRTVAAVPGPVTSPMSAGTNALLRDGAEMVRDAQDLLDALLGPGVARVRVRPDPATLPPPLLTVLDRLGAQPTPAAGVFAGADADEVLGALVELELRGFARRVAGGGYVRAA